jgi:hypothetical protein
MPIADEIKEAIRAARAASTTPPGDPFKGVLDEVAVGLTDESVEARWAPGLGGRWTLWISPAYRPGRALPMLTVVIASARADVLLEPKQSADRPEELARILKGFVVKPEVLDSLEVQANLAGQPVEGFLRLAPKTVSREDLMLEVTPPQQREIAEHDGREITLRLRVSSFPGAGKLSTEATYQVLESAGYAVTLSGPVTQDAGLVSITGHVQRTASS